MNQEAGHVRRKAGRMPQRRVDRKGLRLRPRGLPSNPQEQDQQHTIAKTHALNDKKSHKTQEVRVGAMIRHRLMKLRTTDLNEKLFLQSLTMMTRRRTDQSTTNNNQKFKMFHHHRTLQWYQHARLS